MGAVLPSVEEYKEVNRNGKNIQVRLPPLSQRGLQAFLKGRPLLQREVLFTKRPVAPGQQAKSRKKLSE